MVRPHVAWKRSLVPILALGLIGLGRTQSINIDLDVFFGPPEDGNGAPSDSFSAAAGDNMKGRWNRILAGSPQSYGLFDLAGSLTGATIQADTTYNGGGSGITINSGDFRALLNDYAEIPDYGMTYRFSGLRPGTYRLWTYAVNANAETVPVKVTVDGSKPPYEQIVTGPMPGDSFEYLITHSVHEIDLNGGDLVVHLSDPYRGHGEVNGFQIEMVVPEPSAIISLAAGALLLARRRKPTHNA